MKNNFVADRLKRIREQHNLSLREMGRILEITHVTIANYENGTTNIPLDVLTDLCNHFEIDLNYFMVESEGLTYYENLMQQHMKKIDNLVELENELIREIKTIKGIKPLMEKMVKLMERI